MRPLRYLNGRTLSPVPAEARHADVLDRLLSLQNTSCQADAGSVRSQHRREEIVGNGQQIGTHSILSYQQPPCEALLGVVQPIAHRCLCKLKPLKYCIAVQYPLELRN